MVYDVRHTNVGLNVSSQNVSQVNPNAHISTAGDARSQLVVIPTLCVGQMVSVNYLVKLCLVRVLKFDRNGASSRTMYHANHGGAFRI